MLAASCLLSEEQFLCCICLDVFTDPVTIPCGHNFCKKCITQHWDVNFAQCVCPMCKKRFRSRPELPVNTFISEMAAEFRQSAGRTSGRSSEVARPGDVPCDICTGPKLKALKSCLTCFASYCGVHLDPHLSACPLKRHSLTEPLDDMEARVCTKHRKTLELFCTTDQTCLCSLCIISEHMTHNIASLKDAYETKKVDLELEEAAIQQMTREIKLKIHNVRGLKTHSREDAEREIADGVRIFTVLMQTAERDLNQLIETIEGRQTRLEEEVDGLVNQLQQDVSALTKRTAELQQLSRTQDHLHLLQNFTPMNPALCNKSWMGVSIHPPSHGEAVLKAVAELEEMLTREKKHLLHKATLRSVQHYAVDVVLEHATANPWLILSDDGKQVWCGEVRRELPDNAERFSLYATVLAQQSFSSGRFYYEVQVRGKTDWTLGVVKGSVNRKGIVPLSPANGYWAVGLRNGNEYLTLASPVVSLSLTSRPQTVGVFVSYEEGLVSFWDVGAADHLHTFADNCFTEKLNPFFSPGLHHGGKNSAPLTISPVSPAD